MTDQGLLKVLFDILLSLHLGIGPVATFDTAIWSDDFGFKLSTPLGVITLERGSLIVESLVS